MSNLTYSSARVWDPSEAVSIHGASSAMMTSIDGGLVPTFSTTAARDTASVAMIASGRKGMMCWTTAPKSLWTHDGTTWRMVPVRDVTYQTGVAAVSTDSNGLFGISHSLGTANLSCQFTQHYAGPDPAATDVAMRIKLLVHTPQATQVVGWAVNTSTSSPYTLTAIEVHWRFDRLDY